MTRVRNQVPGFRKGIFSRRFFFLMEDFKKMVRWSCDYYYYNYYLEVTTLFDCRKPWSVLNFCFVIEHKVKNSFHWSVLRDRLWIQYESSPSFLSCTAETYSTIVCHFWSGSSCYCKGSFDETDGVLRVHSRMKASKWSDAATHGVWVCVCLVLVHQRASRGQCGVLLAGSLPPSEACPVS